jgi:hypothetical protein
MGLGLQSQLSGKDGKMGTPQDWMWVAGLMLFWVAFSALWKFLSAYFGQRTFSYSQIEIAASIVEGSFFGFFLTFGLRAFRWPIAIVSIVVTVCLIATGSIVRSTARQQEPKISPPR